MLKSNEIELKDGFNIIVVYYDRYERPNGIKAVAYQDIGEMYDFISNQTVTVMSVYYAVCKDGSIVRGINVPKVVRYNEYYEYKRLLHLEYCNEQG